jgi:hypothetical protein
VAGGLKLSFSLPFASRDPYHPFSSWLVWLTGSSRTNNADGNALKSQLGQSELHATESRIGIVDTSTSERRAREET